MKIESGRLNQKITFVQYDDDDDGAGGSVSEESVYWATSAMVKQLSSGKDLQANQETLKPVFEFTVRFRKDKSLNVGNKLKWRGQLFEITFLEPDFVYKEYLKIKAKSIQLPNG